MRHLIIGSSAAGISAARTIRKLDPAAEITIISKDETIYSRCLLHHFISGARSEDRLAFIPADFMVKKQIDWKKGQEVVRVIAAEKLVETKKGEKYSYDKLLIATGSRAFLPPIAGLRQGKQVYTLRDLQDAKKIKEMSKDKQQIAIIGAGLIGIDLATSLKTSANQVAVIELAPHILPLQLDQQAAANYEKLFNSQGIEIYTNNSVNEVILDQHDNVVELVLQDGNSLKTDLILVATGVRTNVSLVDGTGVKIDKGILVDEHQESSSKDIYAAGDVCQSYEVFQGEKSLTPIWPVAVKQGETAAYNMVGLEKRLTDNFASKNSMRFAGLSTISYGLVEPPDNSYQIQVRTERNCYQKVIYKDGIIYGALIQGELENAGVLGKLIKDKIAVDDYLDNIFTLSYADFFAQQEDASFSYKI